MTRATQPARSTSRRPDELFTGKSGLSQPAPADFATLQLLRDEHVRQGFATLELYERMEPARARMLVGEHMHDATGDLDRDGWHGAMNYLGFTRPIWAWLRGDAPGIPNFFGTVFFMDILMQALYL